MADNVSGIIAIELLCAAQGIDFRAPLKTSTELQAVMSEIRSSVPFYESDRYMADDIEAAKQLVESNQLTKVALLDSIIHE